MATRSDDARSHEADDAVLKDLGYDQQLNRSIGRFTSFCISFSIISATTAVFTSIGYGLNTGGPAFVLFFPIAVVVGGVWCLIIADMSTKLPVAGYAYQWTSRLLSRHYGWFTGWIALVGWTAGMTGVTFGCAAQVGALFGFNVTAFQQALITVGLMALVVLINIFGIRITTRINNVGAMTELVATAGLSLVILAAFLLAAKAPSNGLGFLTSRGTVTAQPYIWAWISSGLTGLWGLLGAESVADVAEETNQPSSTIPKAIARSFILASIVEFFMFAVFTLAIPDLATTQAQASPISYITSFYLGQVVTKLFLICVIIAMFACSMANMLVLTRLSFSMARDKMLPFSHFLGHVSPRFKTPVYSILTFGVISSLFVMSAKAVGYIVGMSANGFYAVMFLMAIGLIISYLRGRLPKPRPGFDLGKWRLFVYIIGTILFFLVSLELSLTPENRLNGRNFLIVIGLGVLWWVFVLRGRINRGEAGAPDLGVIDVSRGKVVSPKQASV